MASDRWASSGRPRSISARARCSSTVSSSSSSRAVSASTRGESQSAYGVLVQRARASSLAASRSSGVVAARALLGQCLEPPHVDVVDLGHQRVAGGRADQPGALARRPLRLELGAQPGDRDLQGAERLAGRLVAPDLGEQPLGRDRGAVRGEQDGEDSALASPGEWLADAADGDRHLSEGGVVHAHAGHARARGFPRSRGKPPLPVRCNAREVADSRGKWVAQVLAACRRTRSRLPQSAELHHRRRWPRLVST